MDSFNEIPVRVLWSTFSNTIPAAPGKLEEIHKYSKKHNLEIIFWNQGEKREHSLQYFFPMNYSGNLKASYKHWVTRFQSRYPDMLNTESVVSYVVNHFELLCDVIQPDIFISWNRHDPTFGLPSFLAQNRGVKCLDLERSLVPELLCFGLNFREQSFKSTLDEQEIGSKYLGSGGSGHIYPNLSSSKRLSKNVREYILILGSWDAVVDSSESLFSDSNAMASFLAQSIPSRIFLYKPHPLALPFESKYSNLRVSNFDPTKLIIDADAVVTSGSKLELDTVISRKPLILAGRGFLFGTTAARRVISPDELINAIETVDHWYDPDESFRQLTGYVGRKLQSSWFSLEPDVPGMQDLNCLLSNISSSVLSSKSKPNLSDSLIKYFGVFVNRYDRSGLSGFSGQELIEQLYVKVKKKIERRSWL